MTRASVSAGIHQAELRCAQSLLQVRSGLHRLRATSSAKLSQPSTPIIVAGFTGLFGFWVARRTRSRPSCQAPDLVDAITTSALRLMLAWFLRLGFRRLVSTVNP